MRNKFQYLFSQLKFNASKNYYQTLNLTKTATPEEIKAAYYNLAKLYHPDKNPNEIDKFKAINEAYEVLKNPTTKKDYDDCQGDPQTYQKKQYERQYHQHQNYNYSQNANHEHFRKVYEEYKRQNSYQTYQYQSKKKQEDDPFRHYREFQQQQQFDLGPGRRSAMGYFMIFLMGMSMYFFFEIFGLLIDNQKIVVVDQDTGQQYLTTRQELKKIQMSPRQKQEQERMQIELKIQQQEELRRMRQRQYQNVSRD